MAKHMSVSRTAPRTKSRTGLSVGDGDGRENELRETRRALGAKIMKIGMNSRATTEDLAVVRRLWRRVTREATGLIRATRRARVERARALTRAGRLESSPFLDEGVDGLLGQRAGSEDPNLGRYRAD